MSTIQLVWLSLLQGLTEFLPISSSGHLILFAKFSSFADQGLAVDVALHLGSFLAVLIYFHKIIAEMVVSVFSNKMLPNFKNENNRLAYFIVFASIPALLVGFFLRHYGMEALRSPKIIGWTILIYGLFLYFADKYGKTEKSVREISFKESMLIGLAQCLALIPGTSRSGVTITVARALGVDRSEAAKFSMLLSLPTILAAASLEGYRLFKYGHPLEIVWATDAVIYSFIASIVVIYAMMKWLKKSTYLPFVFYRVILGVVLILYSYGFF